MNKIKWVRHLTPAHVLILGFLGVILTGMVLLLLPISAKEGIVIHPIDALFTSTSAVCVTGLATFDLGDSLTVFGQVVVALLIQIGGLGFMSVAAILLLLMGKRIGLKERIILKEALNLESFQGIVRLLKAIVLMTLCFEGLGFLLSLCVFSGDYPFWTAVGISAFHAISAFNNAGFDILGNFQGLTGYKDHLLLNLITAGLIIFGGLGFYVIQDVRTKRRWSKLTMHSKIVLLMTSSLLVGGTLLVQFTEEITWLGAFFASVSARTAGFSTFNFGDFTGAGLFVIIILMFIGASPGSTGGGIKTTTTFTLLLALFSLPRDKQCVAFGRRISTESIMKAFSLTFLALCAIILGTFIMCLLEPHLTFIQILFEVVSGFGTVGLSTGITPELHSLSKAILVCTMFLGRLGPLTIACAWKYNHTRHVNYVEEKIIIG